MLTRRELLKTAALLGVAIASFPKNLVFALDESKKSEENAFEESKKAEEKIEKAIKEVFGKSLSDVKEDSRIKLEAPTIAENGMNVPVGVIADIPVENVKSLHIFVDENPYPHISSIDLTSLSGEAVYKTRIRMAKTSYVRGIALLNDGSLIGVKQEVKVTLGGC